MRQLFIGTMRPIDVDGRPGIVFQTERAPPTRYITDKLPEHTSRVVRRLPTLPSNALFTRTPGASPLVCVPSLAPSLPSTVSQWVDGCTETAFPVTGVAAIPLQAGAWRELTDVKLDPNLFQKPALTDIAVATPNDHSSNSSRSSGGGGSITSSLSSGSAGSDSDEQQMDRKAKRAKQAAASLCNMPAPPPTTFASSIFPPMPTVNMPAPAWVVPPPVLLSVDENPSPPGPAPMAAAAPIWFVHQSAHPNANSQGRILSAAEQDQLEQWASLEGGLDCASPREGVGGGGGDDRGPSRRDGACGAGVPPTNCRVQVPVLDEELINMFECDEDDFL